MHNRHIARNAVLQTGHGVCPTERLGHRQSLQHSVKESRRERIPSAESPCPVDPLGSDAANLARFSRDRTLLTKRDDRAFPPAKFREGFDDPLVACIRREFQKRDRIALSKKNQIGGFDPG